MSMAFVAASYFIVQRFTVSSSFPEHPVNIIQEARKVMNNNFCFIYFRLLKRISLLKAIHDLDIYYPTLCTAISKQGKSSFLHQINKTKVCTSHLNDGHIGSKKRQFRRINTSNILILNNE